MSELALTPSDPDPLPDTCRCGSFLLVATACSQCVKSYCARCLQTHTCKRDESPIVWCCGQCGKDYTDKELAKHECACASKIKRARCRNAATLGCAVCRRLFCASHDGNHACGCDCGSGLTPVPCKDCGVFCVRCVRRRHWHECEKHGGQRLTEVCATPKVILCPGCWSGHECTCACKEDGDRYHCGSCGKSFCYSHVWKQKGGKKSKKQKTVEVEPHACACPSCETEAALVPCALCVRIFCNACLHDHFCACADCDKAAFHAGAERTYCTSCLRVFCANCEAEHTCAECFDEECIKAAEYLCDCKAFLCEVHLTVHVCPSSEIDRIREELRQEEISDSEDDVQPCPECDCAVRVGTWNINHLSASTKDEKMNLKYAGIKALCTNDVSRLDVLALQEVNSTAGDKGEMEEKIGKDLVVLHWGPLLKSESLEGRAEFKSLFPVNRPKTKSSAKDGEKRRDELYGGWLKKKENLEKYKAWCKAVTNKADALKKKSLRKKVELELADKHKDVEAMYLEKRVAHDRYQEYYPLIAHKDSLLEVADEARLLWGHGKGEPKAKAKQVVYFRSVKKTIEVTKVELKGTGKHEKKTEKKGLKRKFDLDDVDEDGEQEEEKGQDEEEEEKKEESDEDDDDDPVDGDVQDAVEYRPIVVYDLTKRCAKEKCDGVELSVAVVHTSPGGNEFERIRIFQKQLKKVFAEIDKDSKRRWIVVGDYYLSPEALVVKGDGRYQNRNRKTYRTEKEPRGRTFQEQLPLSLEIVASVSGTNAGTWKPGKKGFDSRNMQVADFAVCSTNWPFRRGFALDAKDGGPMILDAFHHAFRRMKSGDASDHSPVLIMVSLNPKAAEDGVRTMFGYDEKVEKAATKNVEAFDKNRKKAQKEVDNLKKKRTKLETRLREEFKTTREMLLVAHDHRELVAKITRVSQKHEPVQMLDFIPVIENC